MNSIILINHEYGSGGRKIGKLVADKMGIPFYDKDIIALTAKKSGFTEEFVREASEKKTTSLLYSLYMTSLPISDQLFLAQSQVVKDVADKGACVIVGACADYVLRDKPNCFKVFIYSSIEERIRRVRDEYQEKCEDFRVHIQKQDKKRVAYYNYFTQYKWGQTKHYHLSFDSCIGDDISAAVICDAVQGFMKTARDRADNT